MISFIAIVVGFLVGAAYCRLNRPSLRERCLLLASEHFEAVGEDGVIAAAMYYEFYVLTGQNINSDPNPSNHNA